MKEKKTKREREPRRVYKSRRSAFVSQLTQKQGRVSDAVFKGRERSGKVVYIYCTFMYYIHLFDYFCQKSDLVKWSGSASKDGEAEPKVGGSKPRIPAFVFYFLFACFAYA